MKLAQRKHVLVKFHHNKIIRYMRRSWEKQQRNNVGQKTQNKKKARRTKRKNAQRNKQENLMCAHRYKKSVRFTFLLMICTLEICTQNLFIQLLTNTHAHHIDTPWLSFVQFLHKQSFHMYLNIQFMHTHENIFLSHLSLLLLLVPSRTHSFFKTCSFKGHVSLDLSM